MRKFDAPPTPALPALPAPMPVAEPLAEVAAAMRETALTNAMQMESLLQALATKQWSRIKVHISRDMKGDMEDLEFTKT
jgi:hypothetical protein